MSYLEKFYQSYTKEEAISTVSELVQPKMYKITLPQGRFIQEQLPDHFQTKWSKLLSDVYQNAFILSSFAKAMFKEEVDFQYLELSHLSIAQVTGAKVSVIYGGFPNKKEQDKYSKLIQSTLGDEFVVMTVNGDNTTNREVEEDTKKLVAKSKKQGKRVILVSRDMGSRSFSVSEVDTVFLMYDNGSLSQTKQKISRPWTPGLDYDGCLKKDGTVITLSFDSNREELNPIDYYIIQEAAQISAPNESLQESIKRVNRSYNIFVNDVNGLAVKLNPDQYAEELITSSDLTKVGAFLLELGNINLDLYLDKMISDRKLNNLSNNEDKVEVNIKKVKTFHKEEEEGEGKDLSPNERKQLIENIIFLNNNITVLVEYDGFENEDILGVISSLENKGLQSEVEDYFGLEFDFIKVLIKNEVLPLRFLNTVIKSYLQREEEFVW